MSRLLSPDEPFAVRVIPAKQEWPFLLVCDHASNRVPKALNNLGLPDVELARHIGWDIGAERVTELLAQRLGCAAVLANYSRLVVDVNRHPSEESAMPAVSDETPIPANQALSEEERAARAETFFTPYHKAIADELLRLEQKFPRVAVVAVHSFTPCMRQTGKQRPWHLGVLWRHDKKSADQIMSFLNQRTELEVGDNEPYSLHQCSCFTIKHHAENGGRPSLMVEIRQDEIADARGQEDFANLLGDFLETYRVEE